MSVIISANNTFSGNFLNLGKADKIGLFSPDQNGDSNSFLKKIRDSLTITASDFLERDGISIDDFTKQNREMLSKIENLPENEKESVLMNSYKDMQTHLYLFAKNELNGAKDFKKLLEQKDYYSSVLSGAEPNTDYRDEAQYLYATYGNDEFTDKDYLQMRLDDTQRRIDRFINNSHQRSEHMKGIGFIDVYASSFIAAGGDSEKVTNLLDNPETINALKDNFKSRTEENYIQKSEEAVGIYESLSKGLEEIMQEYQDKKAAEHGTKPQKTYGAFLLLIRQIKDNYSIFDDLI
ncbi:MAG: hypothetical protein LBM87_06430 [Ruminococcus sp.]|nr:hypothetical protein [Ruminococcus sp.]